MRKILRSIARSRMERRGIANLNKPQVNENGFRIPSKFATNWRRVIGIKKEARG
jgi:hypothetical protein